jgi:hypothetical protein
MGGSMKKTLIMSLAVNAVLLGALACIFCGASSLAQTHATRREICLCYQRHFGC